MITGMYRKGTNVSVVQINKVNLLYSYRTCVAFTDGKGKTVHLKGISPTSKKHANQFDRNPEYVMDDMPFRDALLEALQEAIY